MHRSGWRSFLAATYKDQLKAQPSTSVFKPAQHISEQQ
jgi:hypothetical protein